MAAKPTIVSIDNLKKWFFQQGYPIYKIYIGHMGTIRNNRSSHYAGNDADITLEEAWEMLKGNLEIAGSPGAEFTIMVKPNATTTGNAKTFFKVPETSTAVAVNGMPTGISQAQMNMAIENAMLKRDVQDLTETIKIQHSPTTKDRLIDGFIDNLEPLMNGVFGMFIKAQGGTVPIHGPSHKPHIPSANTEVNADPAEGDAEDTPEIQRSPEELKELEAKLLEVNQLFHKHFGDDYVNVLHRLATAVDNDPAKFKGLLNFI